MKQTALTITFLALVSASVATAQTPVTATWMQLESQIETFDEQSRTPLGAGDRHRIVYASEADTAVVWTDVRGVPRIVRAEIDGVRYARTLTEGTFPLSDSLLQAYRWMQDPTFRRRLEALLDDDAVTVRNQ
jgi:hypothetical protein